jgi:hypothetical protein
LTRTGNGHYHFEIEIEFHFQHHMTKIVIALLLAAGSGFAQDRPFFTTYDHTMEEPGNLELSFNNSTVVPRAGQAAFTAPWVEMEYGIKNWWTTEFYLEGQSTKGDSAIFTGWRLENRFKPLNREHRINPIFYLEYEHINEASKINKEIAGHSEFANERNDELRREHARELEGKLNLSSNVKGWNISENFIIEKNFAEEEPVEYGYAFGVARPLSTVASAAQCSFCRENFTVGAEVFGGLGDTERFGFARTAQYAAPVVAWRVGDDAVLKFSPAIGLNKNSYPVMFRVAYTYEFRGLGGRVASLFRSGR